VASQAYVSKGKQQKEEKSSSFHLEKEHSVTKVDYMEWSE